MILNRFNNNIKKSKYLINIFLLSIFIMVCLLPLNVFAKKKKNDDDRKVLQPYVTFDGNNLELAKYKIKEYDMGKIPYRISINNEDGLCTYEYHYCTEEDFKKHGDHSYGKGSSNNDIYIKSIEQQNDEGKNIGWSEENNNIYYKDMNGDKKKGWQYIDKTWYYFEPSTYAMTIGWKVINNKTYYFDNDGKMLAGWHEIDHNWYYFEDNGEMIKDWKRIDSKWYYFDKDNGALQVSKWIDNIYYVNENGEMLTSGYHNVDGQMLYFENDGKINRNRNYEQEIRAQQNAANKQNNSSYSSDLPEVHYIYDASSINSVLRECIKYYDSAIAGNRMDVILLKGKVEQLESLVNVARSRTFGEMVGTGRRIGSDLEREFKLLDTIIAGLKGYVLKNLY